MPCVWRFNVWKVSYRAAMGGLRKEKRWEAAVKLLGDMQRRGVGPDEVGAALLYISWW